MRLLITALVLLMGCTLEPMDVLQIARQVKTGSIAVELLAEQELELVGDLPEGTHAIYPQNRLTISVTTSEPSDVMWYRNGLPVLSTGPALEVRGSKVKEAETVRIDCTAYSLAGQKAASLSWIFIGQRGRQ